MDDREPLDGDDVDGRNMEDEEDEEDGLCPFSLFLSEIVGCIFFLRFSLVSWMFLGICGSIGGQCVGFLFR